MMVETVQGSNLTISLANASVMVNGAKVVPGKHRMYQRRHPRYRYRANAPIDSEIPILLFRRVRFIDRDYVQIAINCQKCRLE